MKKNKTIKNILFILCVIIFISLLAEQNVYAMDDKIDITIHEPLVLIEGEEIDRNTIASAIFYENLNLKDKIQSITIYLPERTGPGGHISETNITWTDMNDTTPISTIRNLTESEYDEGKIIVEYISPLNEGKTINEEEVKTETKSETKSEEEIEEDKTGIETAEIPLVIKYNYKPIASVPHLYISEEEFNNMNVEQIHEKILSNLKVFDPEGKTKEELTISIDDLKPYEIGMTNVVSISIDDLQTGLVIPAYVTIVKNEVQTVHNSFQNASVRPISEKYYPYFRDDIMMSGNKYVAKKFENKLCFLNKDGTFLTVDGKPDGNKCYVDACLKSTIEKDGNTYYVSPVSKWVTNGTCASLLTACFSDDKEFIQKWTFDEDDIRTIRDQLIAGHLDKNFYTNHYVNGYCENGSKMANEISIATAAQDLGADGLQWRIDGKTLYIEAKNIASESYTYKMPDFIPSYPNKTMPECAELSKVIRDNPFIIFHKENSQTKTTAPWANYNITNVVIDNKVSYIGAYAFTGMDTIQKMPNIPDNCHEIGEGAFMNCVCMTGGLKTKYVAEIDDFAFANCQEMKGGLTLGTDALTKIGNYAFYGCGFTESLKLPSSLSQIGDFAFAECTSLNGSLIISSNLSHLGMGAFMDCYGFDGDLNVNASLTKIQPLTFANCYGFNGGILLSDTIEDIGDYAFVNCSHIMSNLVLPQRLFNIGVGAFKNCENIKTTLIINQPLRKIGPEAFANCYNITNIDNKQADMSLVISPKAFAIERGIVSTTIEQDDDHVFSDYAFLADGREILNY